MREAVCAGRSWEWAVPTRNSVGAFDEPSTARYQGLADTWRESPKARVGIATDKLVHQWLMTGE